MRFHRYAFCALATLLAAGSVATSTSASARTVVDVDVRVAPPPLRHERVVVRTGSVWVPGYWRWNGHRHIWVAGYAVRARPGWHYVPARWAPNGPHWRFQAGYWSR